MGVFGLWQILESVGHPIKIEGLEGKRLGVDANVWLYKFIRGFREKDNVSNIDSHKLGLFNRISKLLYYRIKPVFVFDGPAPVLKRRTLERRQNVRNKHLEKVQDTAMRLLADQLKKQYPDANVDQVTIKLPDLRSHNLVAAEKLTDEDQELFYLPPEVLEQSDLDDTDHEVKPVSSRQVKQEDFVYHIDSDEEILRPELKPSVDIESTEFASMPAEIRYEILQDIKESRRRIRRVDALPEDAGSFSSFQLERLKARRSVQEKIEKCEKDICSMYTGECNGQSIRSYRMQSDSTSTMLYLKNTASQSIEIPKPTILIETSHHESSERAKTIEPPPLISEPSPPTPEPAPLTSEPSPLTSEPSTLISEPSSPTSEPSPPTPEPSLPTPEPALPTPEPAPPTSEPSTPTSEPSPPTPEPALPTSEPSTLTSEPSTLISEPSSPTSEPSPPTPEPSLPTPEPALPTPEPAPPTSEPSTPTSEPSTLISEPSSPTSEPSPPTPEPSPPTSEPTLPTLEPAPPTSASIVLEPEIKIPDPSTVQQVKLTLSEKNRAELMNVKSNSNRNTNRVTTRIVDEAKELLRLFGIPYIDAAGEAEAQCALLEKLKLTEGTITDDSDVWLFGAQNVYRYFFNDDKYVMQYKMPDIEFHIRMNRENLVCFAMLVGSDYTDGIMNVGPVTALEILSEFPGENMEPLMKFKNWKVKYEISKGRIPGSKKREKLLKFKLPDEFPSRAVFEGYMRPCTDTSTEQFTWGTPELDELREYARRNFGWDTKKIDDKLLPVMKKLSERKIQTTIDSYFFKTAANKHPELFRSKRVNEALNKIATTSSHEEVVLTEEEDGDDESEQVQVSRNKKETGKKSTSTGPQTKASRKKTLRTETDARKRRKVKSSR